MNTEEAVVREGRLTPRPRHFWPTVTVASINIEVLRDRLVEEMTQIFTDHQAFRAQFDGTQTEIDNIIADAFSELGNQLCNELWNRLRQVAESYAPALRGIIFLRKAPSFEGFEVPRFIASLLSGIGPLRIEDTFRETIVVYAPDQSRRDHFGRQAATAVNATSVIRCINALKSANIPLGTIQHRGSQGSFFTTCHHFQSEPGFFEVQGAFHFRHYTRNDIIMAMIFGPWGDNETNPFEDFSITLGFISDEAIVNAVATLNIADNTGNPPVTNTRHVGADYLISYNGIAPASNVPVNARGQGIYLLGRGFDRVFQCSLARNITEFEAAHMIRDHLLHAPATQAPQAPPPALPTA